MESPSEQGPQRPADSFVQKSLNALQKEYIVIGKTRVSSLTSWLVIAFFLGITSAIVFLASQSGTLVGSQAAGTNPPLWEQVSRGVNVSDELHVVSSSLMYAMGTGGRIYRWDGSVWTSITGCCVRSSFAFVNESNIYAIDVHNDVVHWDGKSWTLLGANNRLRVKGHIHFPQAGFGSPQKLYAIGNDNRIWRWDGSSQNWDPITDCCANDDFISLGDDNFYTIGQRGDLMHWNNHQWNKVSSSSSIRNRIRFSQGIQTDLIYAIGKNGNIVRWGANNGGFAPITSGKIVVGDFYFYSETDIYTIARDGNIWHWTGGKAPSIMVVSPNGGETFQRGQTHTVFWNTTNFHDPVSIDLLNENGFAVQSIARNLPSAGSYTESYNWTIASSTNDGQYRLRVESQDGSVQDESDGLFMIGNPSISVMPDITTPASSILMPGQTNVTLAVLKLTASGGDIPITQISIGINPASNGAVAKNFKLYDGTTLIGSIATLPNSDIQMQNVQWGSIDLGLILQNAISKRLTIKADISPTGSGSFKLGIVGLEYSSAQPPISSQFSGFGNQMTVRNVTTPSIAVLSPNGGEVWKIGSEALISWESNHFPEGAWVGRISLYKNNGAVFVADLVPFLSKNNPSGSVKWKVSQSLEARSDYKVQVILYKGIPGNESVIGEDWSDATFSLTTL